MTAHLLVAGAGPGRCPPRCRRAVVSDLLRGELGFTGVVVADALEMAGVAARYGVGGAAVARAGGGLRRAVPGR